MAARITNLRFQQRTADRVNVYLDGVFAFALPAIEAAHLKIGQQLDDDEIARLKAVDLSSKGYDRALRFLSFRPRSAAEVRRNLENAEYDEDVIEAILGRLAEQGYLNDAEFARYWVENRQRFHPKGLRALRQELRQRGIDRAEIDETVAGLDMTEAAYRAARPRAERMSAMLRDDPATFRRKLSEFLLRRGFDYEVTQEVVRRVLRELTA